MAVVTFNKKKFEKEIGKLDEGMRSRIAMFGTPIDREEGNEITIEVFPNRPDLLSYEGFKRGFLGFLGKRPGLATYKVNKPETDYKVIIESSVKDIRPHTACAIVRGLDLDDEKIKEIIDIQERLHITIGRKRKKAAIGIYPMEKIKLPITFKAMEPDHIKFIPLEMDKELSGLEILQKHPKGKDYAHLLAGKIKFPVFTDSQGQVLSMPPIINSQLTGKITEQTKDVFVECSGWDFQTLKTCLNIIVTCLADMGGKIYQMELSRGSLRSKELTPDLTPKEAKISLENTNKLLGTDLSEKDLKGFLERMGYDYKTGAAKVPAWRADILHEVDLIEDAAIAYGYENFVPELPSISSIGEEDPKEKMKKTVSMILAGLGFLEASSYHLTNRKDQMENMGLLEKEAITIQDSKTDYTILRENLSHVLLRIFSENIDSEYPQKIFEQGKVFKLAGERVQEKSSLAAAISPGNLTEAREALEYLFRMLSLEPKFSEPKEHPGWFIEGRTAEITVKGRPLGFLGEIHPKILKKWKIKMPVALLEIDLEKIFEELGF